MLLFFYGRSISFFFSTVYIYISQRLSTSVRNSTAGGWRQKWRCSNRGLVVAAVQGIGLDATSWLDSNYANLLQKKKYP